MRKIGILTVFGLLFTSCSVKVHTLYDHKIGFKQYKTYCWMDGCEFKFTGPSYLDDSLIRGNIKKAVAEELNKKGLTQNTDNPDLLVSFTVTVKDEQAIVYHRTYETPFYKPLENEESVVNYLKGSMVIGMADKKESRIVWQSFANGYLQSVSDFSEQNIKKGIRLILKKYPPKKPVSQ